MNTTFTTHPGAAGLYLAAGASSGLGVAALAFCLPLASYYRASPELFAGSAFALYFLARLAAAPLAGPLSRLMGTERLLMTCLALCGASPSLYALSPSLTSLAAVQGVLGLASGILRPVLTSLAAVHAPDRGRVFTLYAVAANAAFFAGPVIGGLLFLDRDVSRVLWFVAASQAAALALAWKARGLRPPPVPLGNAAKAGPDEQSPSPSETSLARTLAAVFGRTAGAGAWAAFFPILLAQRVPGDPLLFGILAGLPALAACVLTPVLSKRFAGVARERLAFAGMLLSALALTLAPFGGSAAWFALFAFLLGAGTAVSLPAALSLAAGRDLGVTRLGLAQAVAGAGFVLGPLAGALAVRLVFDVGTALAWLGAFGALACLPLALSFKGGAGRSRAAIAGALALAVIPALLGGGGMKPDPGKGLHRFAGVAMGTMINITIESDSPGIAEKAARAAFDEIRDLQADLDHRSPEGSVGRVNHDAGRRPARVTPFAFGVIGRALEVCEASGGALDITIGAVSTRPLYYAGADDAAARLVDYKLVRLDPAGMTVYLPRRGMALDLGAVAKGAILDRALSVIMAAGAKAALVEGGGDFACAGDREWSVGVQNPRKEGVIGVMMLRSGGVCGSGDYRRSVPDPSDPARRLHHIIDPGAMRPARASIAVTAVAQDAELADALSTALFILGPEAGRRLLAEKYPEVHAQWILPDMTAVESPGFPKLSPASKD